MTAINAATVYPKSAMLYCARYHNGRGKGPERMTYCRTALYQEIEPSTRAPDVRILTDEPDKSWVVHSDVIAKQSVFFSKALSSGLAESCTKEINMHDFEAQSIDFIVTFIYKGWHAAIDVCFADADWDEPTLAELAEILLLADYLDMPLLGFEAYSRIIGSLVRGFVLKSEEGAASVREPRELEEPFVDMVQVLKESRTIIGDRLSEKIECLFEIIRNIGGKIINASPYLVAFVEIFADDAEILFREKDW
ncbi:hypothetical protein F5Y04DRAFT_284255 [Hypomontagnella monticulosa]|nr:hypothetical protein F5Y04DRAFT_284255 [Hypomontagnella monticulosa]